MAQGPGKYDPALSEVLKGLEANQGVLMVIDGKDGIGFSIQANLQTMMMLPQMLEEVASQIRADLANMGL